MIVSSIGLPASSRIDRDCSQALSTRSTRGAASSGRAGKTSPYYQNSNAPAGWRQRCLALERRGVLVNGEGQLGTVSSAFGGVAVAVTEAAAARAQEDLLRRMGDPSAE
jgi:hypothetical protein